MEKRIGEAFITLNTVANSSFLVETGELALGGFLDLCSLVEAAILNEKLFFMPIAKEETELCKDFGLFKQLLEEGVLAEIYPCEKEEKQVATTLSDEFKRLSTGGAALANLLKKLSIIMKDHEIFRQTGI